MEPAPNTLLRRASGLALALLPGDQVRLDLEAGPLVTGPHTLALLAAFGQPRTAADVLAELRPSCLGAQDCMDLSSTLNHLHGAGVLVAAGLPGTNSLDGAGGFSAAPVHIAMLDDRERTRKFLQAVREVVRPGDVVVDLGTGTGVLATAAALAGARHVYAVEATRLGEVACRVFAANGVGDRVTLLPGWSTRLELPEAADVLVAEIIGDEPLGEEVLELTLDARRRFLRPGARLIPRTIEIRVTPVEVPVEVLTRRRFTPEAAERWREWYGLDFSPLPEAEFTAPDWFRAKTPEARQWPVLAPTTSVVALDLALLESPSVEATCTVDVTAPGRVNALVVSFDLDLAPGIRLTNTPWTAPEGCHWGVTVWPLDRPLPVTPGDRVRVIYRYRSGDRRLEAYPEGKTSTSQVET